jgi:RNA polymerase sigma-70 factor (ECF subfamily)
MALRIIRACRIPHHEREDLRQDLLADLFARLRGFDPERGNLSTFAFTCFGHRASQLIGRILRGRASMMPVSLDDPMPGAPNLTIGDGLSEADGYGALLGQPVDAFAAVDRRLDLDRALGTLPQEALPLCAELIEQSPHELAKASPTSRATLCCVATPPIAPMFSACLVARSRI